MQEAMQLMKNTYLQGMLDCLSHILTEGLNIEKINQFYTKIKESRALNFEKNIMDMASK